MRKENCQESEKPGGAVEGGETTNNSGPQRISSWSQMFINETRSSGGQVNLDCPNLWAVESYVQQPEFLQSGFDGESSSHARKENAGSFSKMQCALSGAHATASNSTSNFFTICTASTDTIKCGTQQYSSSIDSEGTRRMLTAAAARKKWAHLPKRVFATFQSPREREPTANFSSSLTWFL